MKKRGLFIALEGADKSGKETQSKLLVRHLRSLPARTRLHAFPRYRSGAAYLAKRYLRGTYPGATPEQASIGFTADRLDWWFTVGDPLLSRGTHVVADRWTLSNLAHQGAKLENFEKRRLFYAWQSELEHRDLGLPYPDLTVILAIAPETRERLMASAGGAKDIHERDMAYLARVAEAYRELAELPVIAPKTVVVECDAGGSLLSPEAVHQKVWAHVAPLLARD